MVNNRQAIKPNKEQQIVIDEMDRNILLLASAGTGKTGTLAHRVAHIINGGYAKAEEILCLTFTNKASKEMKDSIEQMVGNAIKDVVVSTFHSFCYSILKEEGKNTDCFYQEMTIFDEEECYHLIKDLLQKVQPYHNWDIKKIQYGINYIKEQRGLRCIFSDDEESDYRYTIEAMYAHKESRAKWNKLFEFRGVVQENIKQFFAEQGPYFIHLYDSYLRDNHAVDFTDLIVSTYRLFRNQSVRKRWENRFSYICIDEVQDTSILEYKVLKIFWPGNRVLLCGDFFQTIYEWRGSMPMRILEEYKKEYNPICIAFYQNYRSTQRIFEASLGVLERLFPNEIWRMYHERPHAVSEKAGAPIVIKGFYNERDESQFIFNEICKHPVSEDESICVLVRNNRCAQELSQDFDYYNAYLPEEKQRKFMIVDQFNFYRRREIKDALAFFKLAFNKYDTQSAKRIIKTFVKSVGEAKMAELESEECRRSGLRLTDFLDFNTFQEEPFEKLVYNLENSNIVVFDVESTGVDTTSDEIIQIAAIRIDSNGRVINRFERFIRPSKSVGSSEAVHGFSDAYLKDYGEEADRVFKDFLQFSENAVIVGHNVQYDISIFTSELHRHKMDMPNFKGVYDTLDIYRRFHPNERRHTLTYLSETFATHHKPSHNAMDDILATAELLVQAVRRDIEPTETLRRVYIQKNRNLFDTMASHMSTLRRKMKCEPAQDVLAYVMNHMGLTEYYTRLDKNKSQDNPNERGNYRMANLRELYRIFQAQEKEAQMVNTESHTISHLDVLQRILQNATLTSSEYRQRFDKGNIIPIITVHQAKGSEFQHVYLAHMVKNTFPSFLSLQEGNIQEENRLFYVAITRPKKSLTVTYSTRRNEVSPYVTLLESVVKEQER